MDGFESPPWRQGCKETARPFRGKWDPGNLRNTGFGIRAWNTRNMAESGLGYYVDVGVQTHPSEVGSGTLYLSRERSRDHRHARWSAGGVPSWTWAGSYSHLQFLFSAPSGFHVDTVVPRRHKGIMHLRFYTIRNLMLKLSLIPGESLWIQCQPGLHTSSRTAKAKQRDLIWKQNTSKSLWRFPRNI